MRKPKQPDLFEHANPRSGEYAGDEFFAKFRELEAQGMVVHAMEHVAGYNGLWRLYWHKKIQLPPPRPGYQSTPNVTLSPKSNEPDVERAGASADVVPEKPGQTAASQSDLAGLQPEQSSGASEDPDEAIPGGSPDGSREIVT